MRRIETLKKVDKGFTLIEILIALSMLTIVIIAIFRVLNIQVFHSVEQRGVAISQTESQLGYRFFKWDFLMAGFGASLDLSPFYTDDSLEGENSVALSLRGTALGLDRLNARWSYRLGFTQDSTPAPIIRYWADSTRDIKMGDYIVLLSDRKEKIGGPYYVSYTELLGGDSMRVYLDQIIASPANIRAPLGTYFVALDSVGSYQNVTYWVDDEGTLKRGDTPLLSGVVAFKVKFGFDNDEDGLIDDWREDLEGLTPQQIHSSLKLVRVSMVVRSRKKGKAIISPQLIIFPDEPMVGEPIDTLEISGGMRKYSYFILSTLLRPRNL